ncbi:uncharacterized protein LOC115075431 isoform X2 [Rhinatrema bivittatum]|uniref:uncharacterized protein LOC115075431 isoform X2 n=1 Tax=Rhinatrema bivittatum TaxID=194408 RepID=UPI001125F87B|nr:uncharacterized protein LOC115075431 isoform X2 [Rhinatrema bivittatum]
MARSWEQAESELGGDMALESEEAAWVPGDGEMMALEWEDSGDWVRRAPERDRGGLDDAEAGGAGEAVVGGSGGPGEVSIREVPGDLVRVERGRSVRIIRSRCIGQGGPRRGAASFEGVRGPFSETCWGVGQSGAGAARRSASSLAEGRVGSEAERAFVRGGAGRLVERQGALVSRGASRGRTVGGGIEREAVGSVSKGFGEVRGVGRGRGLSRRASIPEWQRLPSQEDVCAGDSGWMAVTRSSAVSGSLGRGRTEMDSFSFLQRDGRQGVSLSSRRGDASVPGEGSGVRVQRGVEGQRLNRWGTGGLGLAGVRRAVPGAGLVSPSAALSSQVAPEEDDGGMPGPSSQEAWRSVIPRDVPPGQRERRTIADTLARETDPDGSTAATELVFKEEGKSGKTLSSRSREAADPDVGAE